MLNLASSFKSPGTFQNVVATGVIAAVLGTTFCAPSAFATDAPHSTKTWAEFRNQVKAENSATSLQGTALIVSSVLLVGGSYLIHTNDPVQSGALGLIRTVGLLGFGDGAEKVWISDQKRIFQEAMDAVNTLPEDTKTQVLRAYIDLNTEQERKRKIIKTVTYSLVAAVNFYEGSRQSDDTVKTGLYFLGAVGLLRALTLTIDF